MTAGTGVRPGGGRAAWPADAGARAVVRAARRGPGRRARAVGAGLTVALLVAFAVSLALGDFPIPLAEVLRHLVGQGAPDTAFIVGELRLPRALTGVLVGAAFGISGAIFQSLAGNPLASPDIIGITAGASFAAVLCIVALQAPSSVVALGALAGALVTAAAVYGLSRRRGVSAYRLVLVGIGMAAVLSGLTSYLLLKAEITDAARATVWMTGSLHGRGWEHVVPVGAALAVLLPVTLLLVRPLRALQLRDDTAVGLGVRVERSRLALIVVAVALAAVATASAGPVAFVAFVAAPLARRLVRAPLAVVPAGLMGALLVVVSDVVAREAFGDVELPVGIVTGLVGGPYLLWLLARANRVGRTG